MRLLILSTFCFALVNMSLAYKKDYYSVLGLTESAAKEEIKEAWRQLSTKYLFEMSGNNDGELERLSVRRQEIMEAWEVLGSEKLKRHYDKKGHEAWTGSFKPGRLDFEALKRRDEKVEGKIIIGIDLGFNHASVAIYSRERKEVETIADLEGQKKIPSVVGFLPEGRHLIGHAALSNRMANPDKTIVNVQRLIGKTFAEVEDLIPKLEFKVEEKNSLPVIKVMLGGEVKLFTPEEVTALLLERLKLMAESHIQQRVDKAVITVPAHFTDSQRKATIDAGTIAGLQVVRILNEPTAVAISYGRDDKILGEGSDKNIFVVCLNNGFIDVSLVAIDEGSVEVVASESLDVKVQELDSLSLAFDNILQRADITKKDISDVITSSLMIAQVRDYIADYFSGRTFSTLWDKSSKEEAGAEGAAVQAAVLAGKMKSKEALIIDVTAHSLGIEVNKGEIAEMIPKNIQLPTKKLKPFRVPEDKEYSFTFNIFEGEEPLSHKIGKFNLSIPEGITDAEVKFELNLDGTLRVTAQEVEDPEGTRPKAIVELTEETRLGREQVEELAGLHQTVYEQKRQRKARSDLENLVEESKESSGLRVQAALKASRSWLEENKEASALEILDQELLVEESIANARDAKEEL